MKTIKMFIVLFAFAIWTSGHASAPEIETVNKSEKKLSILLKGYKKMTKTKLLSKKEVINFNKKKLKSEKLSATQVAVVQYATVKGKLKKVYVLEINDVLSFLAYAGQYGEAVSQDGDTGTSDPDCEIITANCGGDTCSCFCVITNTCDPDETESDPNCCDDCDCEEEDGIAPGFDDFMETLTA